MRSQSDRLHGGREEMDRRVFIQAVGAGGVAVGLAGTPLSALADGTAAAAKPAKGKAKSVIQIGIWGGMSQLETFDPKPRAAMEYRSAFKPMPTNVPGIEICETMPMMAKIADKYAIVRTMVNPYTGHSTCLNVMLSNAMPAGKVQSSHPSGKLSYPAVGAVVAMKKCEDGTYKGDIPPWVTIGSAAGAANEGFLGPKWKTFSITSNGRAKKAGGEDQRLVERRDLLQAIDAKSGGSDGPQSAAAETATNLRDGMFRAMSGDAQKVFDLEQESAEVRDRFGRTDFGQACLLARRLVEYGVPFVTILTGGGVVGKDGKRYGWDMHEQLNASIRALCPVFDQALSGLLEDMAKSGLLDTTIVALTPENGKAPNWAEPYKAGSPHPGEKGGRHHWGSGYSCVVAGGGFKGGHVVGEMDDDGKAVQSRPVYPWDLWESAYQLLGIDPSDKLPNPFGCVAPVSQASACSLPRGGLLTEIM